MSVPIIVRLDPSDQAALDKRFGDLARKARNPSGVLKVVGEALLRVQNQRFQSQTDPTGKPWARLKPLTALLRGSRGPILRRSGNLMRSGAWQVSGTTLRIGLNTIYAAVHQFGATIKPVRAKMLAIGIGSANIGRSRGGLILGKASNSHPSSVVMARKVTIPARPIVGFGPKDQEAASNAVADWLEVERGG